MPILGALNKKPKKVDEKLGIDSEGGIINPPRKEVVEMTVGAPMGSLAETALVRRQERMNNSWDNPAFESAFNKKKKKEMRNGITNETGGFGQS